MLFLWVTLSLMSMTNAFEYNSTSFLFQGLKFLDAIATYRPNHGIVIIMMGFNIKDRVHPENITCSFHNNTRSTNLQLWTSDSREGVLLCPVLKQDYDWILSSSSVTLTLATNTSTILSDVSVQTWPLRHYPQKDAHKYKLAVTTMIKDEVSSCVYNTSHCLLEWIEWHRMLGFEHFYLYNHNSTDGVESLLSNYIQADIVTLIHFKHAAVRPHFQHYNQVQRASMNHALFAVGGYETEYLGYFDVDEFFVPNNLTVMNKKGDAVVNKCERGEGSLEKLEWGLPKFGIKTDDYDSVQFANANMQNPTTCNYTKMPLRMRDCKGYISLRDGSPKILVRPSHSKLPPPIISPHDGLQKSSEAIFLHFSDKYGCGETKRPCRQQMEDKHQEYGTVLEKRMMWALECGDDMVQSNTVVSSSANEMMQTFSNQKIQIAAWSSTQIPFPVHSVPLHLVAFFVVVIGFISCRLAGRQ